MLRFLRKKPLKQQVLLIIRISFRFGVLSWVLIDLNQQRLLNACLGGSYIISPSLSLTHTHTHLSLKSLGEDVEYEMEGRKQKDFMFI